MQTLLVMVKKYMRKTPIQHLTDYLAHGWCAISVTVVFVIAAITSPRSFSLLAFTRLAKGNLEETHNSIAHLKGLLCRPVRLANW